MPRPKPSPPDRLRGDLADLQARQDKCRGASLSSRAPRTWTKPGALISRLRTSGASDTPRLRFGCLAVARGPDFNSPGRTTPSHTGWKSQTAGDCETVEQALQSNFRSSQAPYGDGPCSKPADDVRPQGRRRAPSREVTRSLSSGRSASDRRRPRRHRSRPPRRRARSLAPARPRRTTGCWTRRGSGRGLSPKAGLPR